MPFVLTLNDPQDHSPAFSNAFVYSYAAVNMLSTDLVTNHRYDQILNF